MKLAFVDLDGVISDSTERFKKAEAAKQAFEATKGKSADVFWQTAFTPELVSLDTLIPGAVEAVDELRRRGYKVVFLTSRPETMRGETEIWLLTNCVMDDQTPLIMKAPAFQYTKTTIWKAGIVQTVITVFFDVTETLFIDDEQVNRAAVAEVIARTPIVCVASLAEALA